MSEVTVTEVKTTSDLESFIRVPWSIYRGDPNWVPPLIFERKSSFSEKNPWFRHARWKAWIAWRDGRTVGRLSAQIDQFFHQHHDPGAGFFGLPEAEDDPLIFQALFEAAEGWLRECGMDRVVGPFNLGINQEAGLLVEGFDCPPYVMMGHARPYYGPMLEALGYRKATDMLAYEIEHRMFALPENSRRLLERLEGRISVRQVDRNRTPEELETMRFIFNDAWAENWGFVPFTKEEFQAVGKELFSIVPPDYSWISEADGEPAAFIVMLPNLNEAAADLNGRLLPFGWAKLLWRLKVKGTASGRVPLMGVKRKFQHTRLGPALALLNIQALHEPTGRRGMEKAELSWILEDNQAMRNIIEKIGGKLTKRYRMYDKVMNNNG